MKNLASSYNDDPSRKRNVDPAEVQYAGKAALGGNVSVSQEVFGGKGSVRTLADSLPSAKLTPNQKSYVSPISEIFEGETRNGNRQSLFGIVLSADTAVAIIGEKSNSLGGIPPIISFVELPYGEHKAAHPTPTTGKLLATVDTEKLSMVRPEGYVQKWETFTFGRVESDGTSTARDGQQIKIGEELDMSKKHWQATVTTEGIVEVVDTSTNGTSLLTGSTFMRNSGNEQLNGLFEQIGDPARSLEWNTVSQQHVAYVSSQ